MGALKNDQYARDLWGSAYDHIPKAAFAAVAFYLAEQCAGGSGEGLQRFIEEAETLAANRIMTASQASTVFIAIRRLEGSNFNAD